MHENNFSKTIVKIVFGKFRISKRTALEDFQKILLFFYNFRSIDIFKNIQKYIQKQKDIDTINNTYL